MIEGVDHGGVQGIVLLRWGVPEQKGIEVERDVFVKKRDGEVGLRLRDEDAVVVGQSGADQRHPGNCKTIGSVEMEWLFLFAGRFRLSWSELEVAAGAGGTGALIGRLRLRAACP